MSSCRDPAQQWLQTCWCTRTACCLLWSWPRVDFTRLIGTCNSSDVIFQFWWFSFCLLFSSTHRQEWHTGGPIRPIRSCFGVPSPLPYLSDSIPNLCPSTLFLSLLFSLSLLSFSFSEHDHCPLWHRRPFSSSLLTSPCFCQPFADQWKVGEIILMSLLCGKRLFHELNFDACGQDYAFLLFQVFSWTTNRVSEKAVDVAGMCPHRLPSAGPNG